MAEKFLAGPPKAGFVAVQDDVVHQDINILLLSSNSSFKLLLSAVDGGLMLSSSTNYPRAKFISVPKNNTFVAPRPHDG